MAGNGLNVLKVFPESAIRFGYFQSMLFDLMVDLMKLRNALWPDSKA
jgi:hypothetical protein